MRWLLLVFGLALAFAGSAATAALVTTARVALADAIGRRLRGTRESLAWLATTQRQVTASTAATSLGVVLVGVAIPGLFRRMTDVEIGILVIVLGVPVTLLGGYMLPRWLTVLRAERVVEWVRPLLRGWTAVLGVALPVHRGDSRDDVRALVREGAASGVSGDQLAMVGGVMTFAGRPVRAVMTPRTHVVALPQAAAYPDVEAVFTESGYTRVPVYGSTLDEIVGMVHAFDLFKYHPGDPLPLRPVSFAPESRAAADVLLDMQRERQHLAVVVDEFGGTAGIVTLEDLLEALVGEIADEDDAAGAPPPPSGDLLEVDGSIAPAVVGDHFGVTFPVTSAASFGGLLAELAGRIPQAGDRFLLRDIEIDVLGATPARAERLLLRRHPTSPIDLDRVTS